MLQIKVSQLSHFEGVRFERYIDYLEDILRSEYFSKNINIIQQIPDSDSEQAVRIFVKKLVARAIELGIECEGDVTPFCLLAVCMDTEFRQSGIYAWVASIVQASQFTGEERMDAVYSLLPKSIRIKVFQ